LKNVEKSEKYMYNNPNPLEKPNQLLARTGFIKNFALIVTILTFALCAIFLYSFLNQTPEVKIRYITASAIENPYTKINQINTIKNEEISITELPIKTDTPSTVNLPKSTLSTNQVKVIVLDQNTFKVVDCGLVDQKLCLLNEVYTISDLKLQVNKNYILDVNIKSLVNNGILDKQIMVKNAKKVD
jgi:hypothetical protein